MYTKAEIKQRLMEKAMVAIKLLHEDVERDFHDDSSKPEMLAEIQMKRVVRRGKIVRKVAVKRKGFRIKHVGKKIAFVRVTAREKRKRMMSAKRAWRKGKSTRLTKSKRTMRRSKIKMKSLYHR